MDRALLDKMGEEIKLALIEHLAISLLDNNFEDCDKLLKAYESYKKGYQLLHK